MMVMQVKGGILPEPKVPLYLGDGQPEVIIPLPNVFLGEERFIPHFLDRDNLSKIIDNILTRHRAQGFRRQMVVK